MNIKIDESSAARIVINVEGQDRFALIDTGTGKCCMNEDYYQALGSPPLEHIDAKFRLQTASGALMPGIGFLTCNIQVGRDKYRQQFIVCKHLTPGIILGWDFLSRNQLGITWGPTWTLQLRDNQDTLIQTVEETKSSPAVLAAKVTIPPQSLVLVLITATLPPYENTVRFDIIPL